MYQIQYSATSGLNYLGNPSADLPKTVAYEIGIDYNVMDLFLVHLAGYYKDVSDQTGTVSYTNYDGSVNYSTVENNNYADIRGYELRIDKRFGEWITGWIHYNYMVTTSGYVGRDHYYEDVRMQQLYGITNPYQEIPHVRPYLKANLLLHSPSTFGPDVGGFRPLGDFDISTLFNWKAGKYVTWDPLETNELKENLQWKPIWSLDLKLSKMVQCGQYRFTLFADIKNLFDTEYLNAGSFSSSTDSYDYYKSLHLPMYDSPEYKAAGFVAGDDKPGDVRSDDKPYIDDPDLDFLTHINVRTIYFGLKLDF